MVLKSCRQLHYPCKLSELLKPVKLHESTIAVILVDNILRIFFSVNISWTNFGINWFSYQTSLRKISKVFRSYDPSVLTRAPPPCSGDVQVHKERLQYTKKQHEEEIFPAVSNHVFGYLPGFRSDFLLLSGEYSFVFFTREIEKGICVPPLATFQVMIFFVKTSLSWMTKWKNINKWLSLLRNLFTNMQEQVKRIRECTGYMLIVWYINQLDLNTQNASIIKVCLGKYMIHCLFLRKIYVVTDLPRKSPWHTVELWDFLWCAVIQKIIKPTWCISRHFREKS